MRERWPVVWRHGLVAVCVLAVALLPSCTDDTDRSGTPSPSPTKQTPTPKPTSKPSDDPASDAAALSTLLGSTTPSCPSHVRPGNVTCGKLLASSAELVDLVRVALKKMPKTTEYKDISRAVATFEESYDLVKESGCYTRKGKALGAEKTLREFCTVLASGVTISWINLQTTITGLEQSG